MSVMVAPAGTNPQDKDKWTTIGIADRATFDFQVEPETTLEFFRGSRTTRVGHQRRSVIIDFADGRRMHIPHADVRIEAGKPGSLIVDGTITADKITSPAVSGGLPWREINAEQYHAFPQRTALGLPAPTTTQESPLTEQKFTNDIDVSISVDSNGIYPMISTSTAAGRWAILKDRDLPAFLGAMLKNSSYRKPKHFTQDGKPSIKVGDGGSAGIVYTPTTEDQAQRNLNFALANLAAYTHWEDKGREAAEKARKAEEALKALREAAQKREADYKAAQEKADRERKRLDDKGRKIYNATNGLLAGTAWPMFMGAIAKQKWIDLAKAAEALPKAPSYDEIIGSPYSNGGYTRPSFNPPTYPRVWL